MYLNCPEISDPATTGQYDRLYASRELLWSAQPGRMVRRAVALRDPGCVLDVGCGDGKNALFLCEKGWSVEGFDISRLAIGACDHRIAASEFAPRRIWIDDCRTVALDLEAYDMVIAYGLYHCLDDAGVAATHRRLVATLRTGGLFVYAAFNDGLPVPSDHGTDDLFLRPRNHVAGLVEGWSKIAFEEGIIEEDHWPLVGQHRHSLTWAIYEKTN